MLAILVIDDEELILENVEKTLNRVGYVVYTALDLNRARALIKEKSIDLILCDASLSLGSFDGAEFAFKLYKEGRRVILCSARSYDEILGNKPPEEWHYLSKPFHTGELITLVQIRLSDI